jgi:hypothetical protein
LYDAEHQRRHDLRTAKVTKFPKWNLGTRNEKKPSPLNRNLVLRKNLHGRCQVSIPPYLTPTYYSPRKRAVYGSIKGIDGNAALPLVSL